MKAGVVYLAQPIDTGTAALGAAEARKSLLDAGWVVFDPALAWFGSPQHQLELAQAQVVLDVNMGTLEKCDAVVGLLPADVRSFGVPLELATAQLQDKPTVMVGPTGLVPMALGIEVVDTVQQAVDWLGLVRK